MQNDDRIMCENIYDVFKIVRNACAHSFNRKLNEYEYLSPDNFKYLIRDRHADDQFAVGSIMFETSRNYSSRKTVKISENIEVVIVGDEGQIFFNK